MSSGFMLFSFGCRIWLMLNVSSVRHMRFLINETRAYMYRLTLSGISL